MDRVKDAVVFQPSQYLVNHFKTDAVTGLPVLLTLMMCRLKMMMVYNLLTLLSLMGAL